MGILGAVAPAFADANPDEAAAMRVCDLESKPSREEPLNSKGEVNKSWIWKSGNPQYDYEFSARRHADAPFKNPSCELFVLQHFGSDKAKLKDRCELIRNDLYMSNADLENGSTGPDSTLSLSASDTFLGKRSADTSGDDKGNACEKDTVSADDEFACAYLDFQKKVGSPSDNKAAARKIASACRAAGADMTARFKEDDYASMARAGLDVYGNGYCGSRTGGGTVIIEKANDHAVLNATMGITKLLAPLAAETYIASLQQRNASKQIDYNYRLGFPSAVQAGQIGGGGGYYAGAHGGMVYQGGGYTGLNGGCPYGACAGNGGVVVGGTLAVGGGMGGYGGGCGIPPYSMSYTGCGAGGAVYGGGGYGYGQGGAAYCPSGVGGYYGGGGGYGAGYGVGYGQGQGGYGSAGGYPGYGVGNYGGLGGTGGFPGPYGTGDGSNGWGAGNPYGANGAYGGPQQYGVTNPNNAEYMAAYAKMYEQYAAQLQRQAQQNTQLMKLYKQQTEDAQKASDKSYQTYLAIQMAQWGAQNGISTTSGYAGGGAGSVGYDSSYGGATGVYYPPYSSGGAGFSVGGNFSYSSGASRATGGASDTGVKVRQ